MPTISILRNPLFAVSIALSIAPISGCTRSEDLPKPVTTSERRMHELATLSALPQYPANSSACGVAVVYVTLGKGGNVLTSSILEAPDGLTKHSVESALRQWRFGPRNEADRFDLNQYRISGKLTFYF